MLQRLRNALGNKTFFAAGELGKWHKEEINTENKTFNEMIVEIKNYIDHAETVSSYGLPPLNGDLNDPHFGRDSQLILGIRYAETIFKNV